MVKVIGAGLPRTGTHSLKLALSQLLGGKCYHMSEVFERMDDVPAWRAALAGDASGLPAVLDEFVAAVDWPVSGLWSELAQLYPDALIILSSRSSAAVWWRSVHATIIEGYRDDVPPEMVEWQAMAFDLWHRVIGLDLHDEAAGLAAYERHNATVRATAPADRFLDWNATQGWEPLCAALGLPVPEEAFPHVNSTEEWEQHRREREAEERAAEERAAEEGAPA